MSKVAKVTSKDRISNLPEDLLIKILKDIPTKDAVATTVLSKPFRYIWTMLPNLEYEESNYNMSMKKSIWRFLNKSMERHKAPILESLRIKLGPKCPTNADIGKCIEHAVSRGVSTLRLKLSWSADPIRLPSSLYTCETLVTVTLSNKILVDSPTSCCLSSLKVLELNYVMYKDEASLVSLLSSCPALETLGVKREKDDNVAKFSVNVPSLRVLYYVNDRLLKKRTMIDGLLLQHYNEIYNEMVGFGRCLVIDTPRLEKIHIMDYSGDSCSLENVPCLEEAYIDVECFNAIDKFFTSLSLVSSLKLSLTSDLMFERCSTIKFSRLTKCEISPRDSDSWMDSLMPLLDNTPILKSLIIDYKSTHNPPYVSDDPWSKLSRCHLYPECFESSLEMLELIDYGGREEEQDLVEYILTSAKCLKTATISFKSNLDLEPHQDKETMMWELKEIPRCSKTSQLLFGTKDLIM